MFLGWHWCFEFPWHCILCAVKGIWAVNKCSAVARMGDRLATIDMGRKLGAVPLFGEGELGSHLAQCGLGRGLPPCQVASWSMQPFNNNNNNNNQRQCLWCYPHDRGHCESSPGSFDECRLSARWLPTLRPSQPTWAVSPLINGCYDSCPPSPFVIISQPESWYSFGHNRHGPKIGGGALPPLLGSGARSPSNTMSRGLRPTFLPSGILIHWAIWPQQIWAKNWGAVTLWGRGIWVPI